MRRLIPAWIPMLAIFACAIAPNVAGASTVPTDPCGIISKAKVASIIGATATYSPTIKSADGMRLVQCTYTGQRQAIIGIREYPNAAAAQRSASLGATRHIMSAASGDLMAYAQVMDHPPGTASENQDLERKLLAATLAALR